jgi:Zn-finger nucleic acid-binding protein
MRCPRDNHPLKRTVSERVFGDCCNHCDGIFLSGKGIQAYQQDIVKQLTEHTDQQQPKADSQLTCPHCDSNMTVTHVDEIEIDICKHCLGVWFDKSEAKAIIQKYDEDSISANKTTFAPFPSEFVSILSKWFLNKSQLERS